MPDVLTERCIGYSRVPHLELRQRAAFPFGIDREVIGCKADDFGQRVAAVEMRAGVEPPEHIILIPEEAVDQRERQHGIERFPIPLGAGNHHILPSEGFHRRVPPVPEQRLPSDRQEHLVRQPRAVQPCLHDCQRTHAASHTGIPQSSVNVTKR
jgi:hypothetical protein